MRWGQAKRNDGPRTGRSGVQSGWVWRLGPPEKLAVATPTPPRNRHLLPSNRTLPKERAVELDVF